MADANRWLQHFGYRTILCHRQRHRAPDLAGVEVVTDYFVMQVYLGKNRGNGIGSFGFDMNTASVNLLPALVENQRYVDAAATAKAAQYGFHWSDSKIVAAIIGRAIHAQAMTARGFSFKGNLADFGQCYIHRINSI